MPDLRDVHELQAKVAVLEAQLQAERANAAATQAMNERLLEAERRIREDVEQANANVQQALEEAYAAQLQSLQAELALWRRDDLPGLLQWLERRLTVIDSTLTHLEASPELSAAMRLRLDELRDERVDIVAIQDRLRAR